MGFIFGLPRYSNTPVVTVPSGASEDETTAAAKTAVNATSGLLTPSNNLEQVADWLTKLLIGAGLVQLGAIGTWVSSFINDLAVAFSVSDGPPSEAAKIVAGSILGFSVSIGFVFGYLLTTSGTNVDWTARCNQIDGLRYRGEGASSAIDTGPQCHHHPRWRANRLE